MGIRKLFSLGLLLTGPFMAMGVSTAEAATPNPPATAAKPAAPTAPAASPAKATAATTQFASEAIARGKKIYRTNCLQCHNGDPRKNGAQGPAVYNSSRELLEARVLTRKYPPGYVPQRKTSIMPALPFLKNEIANLHAYLNSPLE